MPRYHFNVYDGFSSPDDDGTDLPNVKTARVEGIRLAGGVIADDANRIGPDQDWRLEVTDTAGMVLYRMDFTVTQSPAVKAAVAR